MLESVFPSKKREVKKEKENEKPLVKESLDVKNTIAKFLLDQTVGAAFNIPLYFIILGTLKGQSLDYILNAIKTVSNVTDVESIRKLTISNRKAWTSTSQA